jgi:pimeloyl-ACP methyl ester carboxylesterase
MKALLALFAVIALAYLLLCAWLWLAQERFVYFPTPAPRAGEHLLLGDGEDQVRVATRVRAGPAAVLYFGGNAEDVSHSVEEIAALFPQAAIYAPHYRGYGGSRGAPSEPALVADALALHERVRREHPDIVIIGRSLGSGVAVQLAAARPPHRLVLVTPFHSLAGVAQQHFRFVPVGLLLRDRYDSERHASRIVVPTTVVIAAEDEIIPRWSSERLAQALPAASTRVHVLPQVGHNTISLAPGYAAALRDTPTPPASR